jgi:hypothetical protein
LIDCFTFVLWCVKFSTFWTFSGGTTGSYVLTVLGIILMVVSIIGWAWLEDKKLWAQTDRLRAATGAAPPRPTLPGPTATPPPAG